MGLVSGHMLFHLFISVRLPPYAGIQSLRLSLMPEDINVLLWLKHRGFELSYI
jgi:hypothetical protein